MNILKEDIIFGRIAVLNNIISKEQLEESLAIQKQSDTPRLLGSILLEKGYITKSQLKAILDTQKRKLPRPAVTAQEKREDIIFGYLAVKHEFASIESIYECFQLQNELARKGLLFRLSELMVHEKRLSLSKAEEIIQTQEKYVIECTSCKTRYNILGLPATSNLTCKKCNIIVPIPTEIAEINGKDEKAVEKFYQNIELFTETKASKTNSLAEASNTRERFSVNEAKEIKQTKDEDICEEENDRNKEEISQSIDTKKISEEIKQTSNEEIDNDKEDGKVVEEYLSLDSSFQKQPKQNKSNVTKTV